MVSGYEIRRAAPEHVPHLQAIELAATRVFPEEDLPEKARSEPIPLESYRSAAAEGRLWLALQVPEPPVGFALLEYLDGVVHLRELDVHPDHARRGLGTALLAAVSRWATLEGYEAITLTTFRHLSWNGPYYEREGFRELECDEITPGLARILNAEAAAGLTHRIAMRLELFRKEG